MNKRVWMLMLIVGMISAFLAGCGSDNKGEKEEMSSTETTGLADVQTEAVEEIVHEHSLVYVFDTENSHNITCAAEDCVYSEKDICSYNDAYVCELCGNKHEHVITYASNADGTHNEACAACGYAEAVNCILGEDYICSVCGWTHEHECLAEANDDETHTYSCKYEACPYSYVENCEYSEYECLCGNAYPWEKDIKYFGENDKNIYYAQKELEIYRYPNTGSEVIGTLGVDEEVRCVGSIFYGSGANYEKYLITENGGCIPTKFHQDTTRWDLRIAKTNQVVARCGSNYTVYDSFDAALQSICGYSWSAVKQTFTYNDYKSQGQPFMNSYSMPGGNITIATKDGSLPYNCSVNGTEYYFE